MSETYIYWLDVFRQILSKKNLNEQEELKPINKETGRTMGFFTAQDSDTNTKELAMPRGRNTIDEAKEKAKQKPKDIYLDPNNIEFRAKESVGK
jgi:hypothetical protein